MTWTLNHNSKTVGEWSDELVEAIASKLRKSKSEGIPKKREDEKLNMIAEFLPDTIRDAFL
ncbi:MAG: hypothetical protein ACJ71K_04250 [Nitrososphaeraceae archaeon]|jgi:hypothetical protein